MGDEIRKTYQEDRQEDRLDTGLFSAVSQSCHSDPAKKDIAEDIGDAVALLREIHLKAQGQPAKNLNAYGIRIDDENNTDRHQDPLHDKISEIIIFDPERQISAGRQ